MMKHWTPKPLSTEILAVQKRYEQALAAVRSAREKTQAAKRNAQDYWIGRLEYGIQYMEAAGLLHEGALADSQGRRADALRHTERALAKAVSGIEAYARVARDQSDRGAIAMMGDLVYRPLKAKVE